MKNTKVKYIIIGAGPAGLAFANKLLELGEKSFIVLEKNTEVGGLCRSEIIDKFPIDTGGGHFLDTKNQEATNFIFKFLPKKEWNEFKRISTIKIDKNEIDYPFESNIWQLPIDKQVKYLSSIFKAGCNLGKKMPDKFIDWITWKLGGQIANDYMIPYNKKVWSINLDKLGTYWLYKLPNISTEETLSSCLNKKPIGNLPAHTSFFYPKRFGYGEVWKRMGDKLGKKLKLKFKVKEIDIKNKLVNGKYTAEKIIITIPWEEIKFENKLPNKIKNYIDSLKHSSIRIAYRNDTINTKAHWTYIPDEKIPEHRHLYRFNFIKNAKGYWTETNEKRVKNSVLKSWKNKFAYPLNTIKKPIAIKEIHNYFLKKSIFGLGRWGEWEHMNSDIAVIKGLKLAQYLFEN